MADQQISVVFTADASPMTAELRAAVNELKKLELALRKTTDINEINQLTVQIGLLKDKISSLGGVVQNAGSKLGTNLKAGANNAAFAVNDLNRVVQDLPYGFIGISNNLTPLAESFQRLRESSKLTGTSLKTELLGALAGPSGIFLAISAVTTAFTFASVGLSRWISSSKDAKGSTDSLGESTKNLSIDIKNLGSDLSTLKTQFDLIKQYKTLEFDIKFGKGISTDIKLAKLDITQLGYAQATANVEYQKARKYFDDASNALYSFTQTQKGSFEETNGFADAVSKLGDLSAIGSADLSKFSDEQKIYIQNVINAGKKVLETRDAYYSYNDQISLAKLKVKALTEEEKRQAAERVKNADSLQKTLDAFERSLIAIQSVGTTLGTPQFEINKDKIKEFESVLKKIIEKFNVDPSNKIYIDLAARLDAIQFEQAKVMMQNMLRKAMKESDAIIESMKPVEFPVEIKPQFNTEVLLEAERQGLIGNIKALSNKLGIKIPFNLDLNTLEGLKVIFANLEKLFDDKKKVFADKLLAVGEVVQSMAEDIGILFAEAIGNAFSGKNFDFLGGLYEILGNGLIKIGKILFVVAGLAEKVQIALSHIFDGPTGPFWAVAAGLAAIALGTAIKNFKSQSQFAVGTNYAPGGLALVGERGPEMVSLPRGSKVTPAAQTAQMMGGAMQQVEVFGVLRGQDIYFSNKKYSQTYRRTT